MSPHYHRVLFQLSPDYPRLRGRLPMCYSPVCHGSKPIRLACLRHAASVHPEPGSNSLLKFYLLSQGWHRTEVHDHQYRESWFLKTMHITICLTAGLTARTSMDFFEIHKFIELTPTSVKKNRLLYISKCASKTRIKREKNSDMIIHILSSFCLINCSFTW